MANIRALAQQHIGRPVIVHSAYGVHRGILHHVDHNGMYLQLHRGGTRPASGSTEVNAQILSNASGDVDAQEVFWPLFFIPWLAAWALYPWWGPYWW
ncbi:hypothetical protein [Alicyclobacillus acidiphilus]|uniref:hypothetical protein n=1 Tax=Alicyclobacillus acidiphilus TaxID=182455 RepID=UPI00082AC24C|nr:hypothetical protein [Alicyclobacillus acidiphilus]